MYSVIESCRHNDIDPGKYVSSLLGKLKIAGEGEDLTASSLLLRAVSRKINENQTQSRKPPLKINGLEK